MTVNGSRWAAPNFKGDGPMMRIKATFGWRWMMASLVLAVVAMGAGGCDDEGGGSCYFEGDYGVPGWCYYPNY